MEAKYIAVIMYYFTKGCWSDYITIQVLFFQSWLGGGGECWDLFHWNL